MYLLAHSHSSPFFRTAHVFANNCVSKASCSKIKGVHGPCLTKLHWTCWLYSSGTTAMNKSVYLFWALPKMCVVQCLHLMLVFKQLTGTENRTNFALETSIGLTSTVQTLLEGRCYFKSCHVLFQHCNNCNQIPRFSHVLLFTLGLNPLPGRTWSHLSVLHTLSYHTETCRYLPPPAPKC